MFPQDKQCHSTLLWFRRANWHWLRTDRTFTYKTAMKLIPLASLFPSGVAAATQPSPCHPIPFAVFSDLTSSHIHRLFGLSVGLLSDRSNLSILPLSLLSTRGKNITDLLLNLHNPEMNFWGVSTYLSVFVVMSAAVMPWYTSVSFHTGFKVFFSVLVRSLFAWGDRTKRIWR